MRRASFAQAATSEGASALNRVFERYLVPINFSSEQLHLHIAYNDVDPSASPIWYDDDGQVLAAALLGIRGKRGWIGGFGVAPEYRGQGYAMELIEALIREARERGLKTLQLEALTDNVPALHVYRNAGFSTVRSLHSFERLVEDGRKPDGFVGSTPDDFVNLPDPAVPCWQRERPTLMNGAVSTAVADAKGSYGLFRYNAHAAQVLKVHAAGPEGLESIAHAIAHNREFQSIMLLNEPEESPICGFARTAGWAEPFTQYELKLELG